MKENAAASPSGSANTRTMVLLGILAVLIAATAYDFLYARPRAKQIHDEIYNFCDDSANNKKPAEGEAAKMYTPADIHKMLGDKFNGGKEYLPSKTTPVPGHVVETYSIMAGAVIRSHDVHVIYTAPLPDKKTGKSEPKFYTVHQGEFPKGDLIPEPKAAAVDNTLPPAPSPAGGGGGGGGRRPGGPGGAAVSTEPKKDEEKKDEDKKEEVKKEGEEKKEESKPEEPKKEEPKVEEPKKEEPKPEEPKKEEPKADEPKPEEPKKEEPTSEESKKEDPKPEEKPEAPKR